MLVQFFYEKTTEGFVSSIFSIYFHSNCQRDGMYTWGTYNNTDIYRLRYIHVVSEVHVQYKLGKGIKRNKVQIFKQDRQIKKK